MTGVFKQYQPGAQAGFGGQQAGFGGQQMGAGGQQMGAGGQQMGAGGQQKFFPGFEQILPIVLPPLIDAVTGIFKQYQPGAQAGFGGQVMGTA